MQPYERTSVRNYWEVLETSQIHIETSRFPGVRWYIGLHNARLTVILRRHIEATYLGDIIANVLGLVLWRVFIKSFQDLRQSSPSIHRCHWTNRISIWIFHFESGKISQVPKVVKLYSSKFLFPWTFKILKLGKFDDSNLNAKWNQNKRQLQGES